MAGTGRRVDFIPQMEVTECGAAGLAMILAWHGHHAPLPEVRQARRVSRDGASALAIVEAARTYGLDAYGVRLDLDQLSELPLPAILHWDFDHFVVLERLGRHGLTLVDPASGRRRVSLMEAGRRFTGAALVFSPTPRLVPRSRKRPSLRKYRDVFFANLPALALLVIGVSLAEAGLMALFWNRNRQLLAAGMAAQGREGAAMLAAVSGLEATKASGAGSRMVQRWAHRMTERVNHSLAQQRLAMNSGSFLALFTGASALLVFLVGGREVMGNRMTLGTFMAFLTLQGLFTAPMGSLLGALLSLQGLGVHLRRLDDVMETAAEQEGGADPGRLQGDIELQDVTYGYAPNGPPAVADISLRIAPGEKVALVGPTGAGKSTLARLLLGLHLPDRGAVRFDGRDLRELDLSRVRSQVGVVMQETFLFDDTVRANLSLHQEDLHRPSPGHSARCRPHRGTGGWPHGPAGNLPGSPLDARAVPGLVARGRGRP